MCLRRRRGVQRQGMGNVHPRFRGQGASGARQAVGGQVLVDYLFCKKIIAKCGIQWLVSRRSADNIRAVGPGESIYMSKLRVRHFCSDRMGPTWSRMLYSMDPKTINSYRG